ncbi:hypothetical protein ACFLZX_01950 [Nanoarchaeota archaeon]
MHKKGVTLSVNFLVVLIIALVLFGMGVKLLWDIFASSSDISQLAWDDYRKQIANLQCRPDERVCYGVEQISVERGEVGIFGVKVINILEAENPPIGFKIEVNPAKYINKEGNVTPFNEDKVGLDWERDLIDIENNEEYTFLIAVSPKKHEASPGKYSFTVDVTCDGTQDDPMRKACGQDPFPGYTYSSNILWVKVP